MLRWIIGLGFLVALLAVAVQLAYWLLLVLLPLVVVVFVVWLAVRLSRR
jgi:hypothetical protein